jgi:hypothetical protein
MMVVICRINDEALARWRDFRAMGAMYRYIQRVPKKCIHILRKEKLY